MSWDKIRKEYEPLIKELTQSVDYQLKLWAETGDENHYLFAQHTIRKIEEIKQTIVDREKALNLY